MMVVNALCIFLFLKTAIYLERSNVTKHSTFLSAARFPVRRETNLDSALSFQFPAEMLTKQILLTSSEFQPLQ